MIEIVNQVSKRFNNIFVSVEKHTQALLVTEERKICTNMGNTIGIGHDVIQRLLGLVA